MATPDNEWWARRSHALKEGYFDIDEQFGPLRGVHNPIHRWNGWATPYFPMESVLRIKDVVENEQDYPQKFTIDDEGVWYWVKDYADEYDDPRGQLEASIEFDGVTLYDIGNGGWCWDEVTEKRSCLMIDPDSQGALDATRAKLLQVQSLLLEVCEIASDDVVADYLAAAFDDQTPISHSLDEIAVVFGDAATYRYDDWLETQ